ERLLGGLGAEPDCEDDDGGEGDRRASSEHEYHGGLLSWIDGVQEGYTRLAGCHGRRAGLALTGPAAATTYDNHPTDDLPPGSPRSPPATRSWSTPAPTRRPASTR